MSDASMSIGEALLPQKRLTGDSFKLIQPLSKITTPMITG